MEKESSSLEPEATSTAEPTPTPAVEKTTDTDREEEGVAPNSECGGTPTEPGSKVEKPHPPQDQETKEKEEEEEELLSVVSRRATEEDTKIGSLERTFASLAIERILGLLAAILPVDMSVCSTDI